MLPQTLPIDSVIELATTDASGNNPYTYTIKLTEEMVWSVNKGYNIIFTLAARDVSMEMFVTDWNDTNIGVNTQGTFLNILDKSMRVQNGSSAKIYYSTNYPASEISATYIGPSSISGALTNVGNKYFEFPSTFAPGEYIVSIVAGDLVRKLKVTVVVP